MVQNKDTIGKRLKEFKVYCNIVANESFRSNVI